MASPNVSTNTVLKATKSAPAATGGATSKNEDKRAKGKEALDRKRKRGSSKRARKKGNRRRSNTPSSRSEVRIRRGSESGTSSSPSYFAVEIEKPGGYEELKVVKKTGKGASGPNISMMGINEKDMVVVSTDYAGVNYADVCIRWGLYTSAKKFVGWPITPGFEFVGTVTEVGDNVRNNPDDSIKIGDKVFGVTMFGGYSNMVQVPRHQVYLVPEELALEEAAALPAVGLTAWYAMFKQYQPRAKDTVLIHSVAGGVGGMLAQLARICNLKVVGVVGSSHKVEYAYRELHCDLVIDKSKSDLWAEAEKYSPAGFNAIFDANGYSTLQEGYNHLAPGGRLIVYGFHSMLPKVGGRLNVCAWLKIIYGYFKTPTFNPLDMTHLNRAILCFNLSFMFDRTDVLQEAMGQLIQYVKTGQLKVPKVTVFPMNRVSAAHKHIESGLSIGKLVLNTKQVV